MQSDNYCFQVETTIDRKCWQEIYWSALGNRDRTLLFVLGGILILALYYLLTSIILYFGIQVGTWIIALATLILATCCGIVCCIIISRLIIKNKIKNYKKRVGQSYIHNQYTFLEDRLISFCPETQKRRESTYGQIERLKETKHYLLIKGRKSRAFCIIDKAGFTIGDIKEFRRFIGQKLEKYSNRMQ